MVVLVSVRVLVSDVRDVDGTVVTVVAVAAVAVTVVAGEFAYAADGL